MSTVPASPSRGGFLRLWLPWLVIGLLLAADAIVWAWPPSDVLSRSIRFFLSVILDGLAVIFAMAWWLFLARARWPLRLAPLVLMAAAGGAAFYSVDDVQLDGDMVPVAVHFRGQATHADLVDASRQARSSEKSRGLPPADTTSPEDFPCYRNRTRDGAVSGPALARDWAARPPREIWKKPCGGGFAGFAVVAGRAVTIEQRRSNEVVVCYDAATGDELWTHSYPARFYDPRGGEGPMATPTIDRGLVFSLGGTGHLACLDLATGKVKWSKDLLRPGENLTWGMSGSPLVYDNVVVVNPGGQEGRGDNRALVGHDRTTGDVVWSAGSTRAGYASPMLATIDGQRQVVLFDGEEIAGYDPTGKGKLWTLPWVTNMGINAAQPLVLSDGRIFVTSGYGVGCDVVKTVKRDGRWLAEFVYDSAAAGRHARSMQGKFSSPVLYKGLVYGLTEGTLTCVDPNDLTRRWLGRRYGHGQLLRSDDLLVILSESGELVLVEAAGQHSRELGRVKVLTGDKTWNCPCLAGAKAYVRNHLEMSCYDLRGPER